MTMGIGVSVDTILALIETNVLFRLDHTVFIDVSRFGPPTKAPIPCSVESKHITLLDGWNFNDACRIDTFDDFVNLYHAHVWRVL
jgi:hypothetical protein